MQAAEIMQGRKWGGRQAGQRLLNEIQKYAAGAEPYDAAYGGIGFDPKAWWANIQAPEAKELRSIALFMLELLPHTADTERAFSTLGYFEEQRPLLAVATSKQLVRIRGFWNQHPPEGEELTRAKEK